MPDNDWSRVVNTTITDHIREVEVDILRNRKLLALLEASGRITLGHGGKDLDWRVQYRRATPQGFGMGDTMDFTQRDRWVTCVLPWRGYAVGDSITKVERLQNKGMEAIIDVFSEITDNQLEEIREFFCDELYIDGNASGNSKRIHGIESFLGSTGTPTGTAKVATNSDSYADKNTAVGDKGGTWTGTWPSGFGPSHYDYVSPPLLSWDTTGYLGAGYTKWSDNSERVLRQGIAWARRNKSKNGRMNMILMDDDMLVGFQNHFSGKETIQVRRGERISLVSLGFDDVVSLDGVECTSEFGVPPLTAYGFNVNQMGIRSLQDSVFVPEGPDYDIASKSWRFSVDFFGNAYFRPRYFCKWYPYHTNQAVVN